MEKIKTTTKQRNILFVDNDKELIRDLEGYLKQAEIKEKHGLNFIFVNSCKEALKKMAEMQIDLVILEVLLPVINGYYFLNAIKKESTKVPVIIYTKLKGATDLAKLASNEVGNIFIKELTQIEDLVKNIVDYNGDKVDLDKVVLELQSQLKSTSENENYSQSKVIQCPRCTMVLQPDSHFCNNCGQKIFKIAKELEAKETTKPVKTKQK